MMDIGDFAPDLLTDVFERSDIVIMQSAFREACEQRGFSRATQKRALAAVIVLARQRGARNHQHLLAAVNAALI
ncbi:MAG: hypothetical protein J0H41_05770 [Rhizobiales bacterium]|nr:hypothetical protein [Hyphomicrobiales bacterium]